MADPMNDDLVGRLESIARDFRLNADHKSAAFSALHEAVIRDVGADRLAEFAETVLAILKARPSAGHEGEGG